MIVIVFLALLIIKDNYETFNLGYGTGFGMYYPPQKCDPKSNCFKGAYLRSQQYHNVCPPKYGLLNREKILLQDDCSRTLGDYPKSKYKFKCQLDKHLRRHCKWVSNKTCNCGCSGSNCNCDCNSNCGGNCNCVGNCKCGGNSKCDGNSNCGGNCKCGGNSNCGGNCKCGVRK